jgi:hypothetical protein
MEVQAKKVTTRPAPQIESMTVRREAAPVKSNGVGDSVTVNGGGAAAGLLKQMQDLQRSQAKQEYVIAQQLQYRLERERLATAMQMSKQAIAENLEAQKWDEVANAIAILVEVAVRQIAMGVRQ